MPRRQIHRKSDVRGSACWDITKAEQNHFCVLFQELSRRSTFPIIKRSRNVTQEQGTGKSNKKVRRIFANNDITYFNRPNAENSRSLNQFLSPLFPTLPRTWLSRLYLCFRRKITKRNSHGKGGFICQKRQQKYINSAGSVSFFFVFRVFVFFPSKREENWRRHGGIIFQRCKSYTLTEL